MICWCFIGPLNFSVTLFSRVLTILFSEKLILYVSNLATLSDISFFPLEVLILKLVYYHRIAVIAVLVCIFNCVLFMSELLYFY